MIDNTYHLRRVRDIALEVAQMCHELDDHILAVAESSENAADYRAAQGLQPYAHVPGEITLDRRKTAALRRRSLDLSRALSELRRTHP